MKKVKTYIGKTCRKCGKSERYFSNNQCKSCKKLPNTHKWKYRAQTTGQYNQQVRQQLQEIENYRFSQMIKWCKQNPQALPAERLAQSRKINKLSQFL